MARITVTLAQEDGSGKLILVKGATVKSYVYDSGQPNNRGTLLGTHTETPANSGQYALDVTNVERIVVTADTGSGESNLPAWEGKKVWGNEATSDDYQNDSVITTKIPDESITGAKAVTGFLEVRHFTSNVVPAGAIDIDAFNTTEFEKLAGIIQHKTNGLDGAKLLDESLTGAKMIDETLEERHYSIDSIIAAHTKGDTFLELTQFERTGIPAKWQLREDFLATLSAGGVNYILNVLDYGADTSGVGSSSQAFQDAFDDIGEEQGIVIIPPGTYLCQKMTIGANTWVWAHGALIAMGGTAPTGAGTGKWLIKSEGAAGAGNQKENIRIEGGVWRGELVADYTEQADGELFSFTYCNNVSLRNLTLEKSRRHGLLLSNCSRVWLGGSTVQAIAGGAVRSATCSNISVDNIFLTDVSRAVDLNSGNSNIYVNNCQIETFFRGIVFRGDSNIFIQNNVFEASGIDSPDAGIYHDTASLAENVVISQNFIKSGFGYPVYLLNSNANAKNFVFSGNFAEVAAQTVEIRMDCDITDNTFNASAGAYFNFANDNGVSDGHMEIARNRFLGAGEVYFRVIAGRSISLADNVIELDAYLAEGNITVVRGNDVRDYFQIDSEVTPGLLLTANTFRDQTDVNTPAQIQNNVFLGATAKLYRPVSNSFIKGNSFRDNVLGIELVAESHVIVDNNLFDNCTTGISLGASASGCQVRHNYFRETTTSISDSGNNTVENNYGILEWQQVIKLQSGDIQADDRFGIAVAIDGTYAIIGAPREDTGGSDAGAVYIFERSGTWAQVIKLQSSDIEAGDQLGEAVAISGNYAIAGARFEATGGSNAGAVYIFERNGTWAQAAKLQSSDIEAGDQFGISVAIDGNRAIVGAYEEDTTATNAGAAYIFERDPETEVWSQVAKIQASDAEENDRFGRSVAISGDRCIVGAYLEDAGGGDAGAAYIFERDGGGTWNQVAKLQSGDIQAGDQFGIAVAIDGDYAIVGAFNEDTGGSNAGSAYIFERSGTWSQVAKLQSSDIEAGDQFGESVAISGNRVIVGASLEDAGGGDAGAAYIFERDDLGNWDEVLKITAEDAQAADFFGFSTGISGSYAVVGAFGEDAGGSSAGAAYIFEYK